MAKKLDMTRVIKGDTFVPVTLLEVPQLRVVWIKTVESDGYEALVVWILKNLEGGKLGEWKKALNVSDFATVKEYPMHEGDSEKFSVGDTITLDCLEWIETVSVVSVSKWKGFTWAMKRHNFHGWPASQVLNSIGHLVQLVTENQQEQQRGKRCIDIMVMLL